MDENARSGRFGETHLQLYEGRLNLLCVLRYAHCPVGKGDFQYQISRHGMKCVLKSHLVARRNNGVTCPCDPTAEL